MNITIIGGGLGGLATAIALHTRCAHAFQNEGLQVQVYERAQALRPIGAGLTLTPNGLRSLNAMQPDIVTALKQAGSPLDTLTLKHSTGATIATKPMTIEAQYGYPMLNIQWSQLQAILAAALPSAVIHLNQRCVGFEQTNHGVTVSFENGNTIQSDLLVGADGINSVVRQQLIGDGSPAYAERMSWRAVVRYAHPQLQPHAATLITVPDGKNFLLVDVGGGYTFWSAGALAENVVCQHPDEVKARVLETFANWADPVGAIVDATPATAIVERPIYDRPPLQTWSKGRVTLLGDAAHPVVPSLGQGANMAFEDAYELAECLATAPSLTAALTAYETSRISRTTVIYDRSAMQGQRSYKPDSIATLQSMMAPARLSQDDFEAWLYSYPAIAH